MIDVSQFNEDYWTIETEHESIQISLAELIDLYQLIGETLEKAP